jgi:hypothetical protein
VKLTLIIFGQDGSTLAHVTRIIGGGVDRLSVVSTQNAKATELAERVLQEVDLEADEWDEIITKHPPTQPTTE